MKILYLVDQLYKCGGLERVLSHKINYITSSCSEVTLALCTNEQENKKYFFNIPDVVLNFDLDINYNHAVSLYSLSNIKKAVLHYLKLKKMIAQFNPDVIVHCGFGYDFYFLPLICKKSSIKIIKENHSSRFFSSKKSISIRKLFEKYYDMNVFLSKEEQLLSSLKNSMVITNPIISAKSEKILEVSKKPIVISAGRVAPVKGFERLIEVWALVSSSNPNWQLHFYGDGEEDYIQSLMVLIQRLGLTNSVIFFPAVDNVEQKISEASIFAMTSHTECFPMVLLEAMQCNTPVIAFDCPTGPRNILEKDCGVIVENGNIKDFSRQLNELMTNPELRMCLAGNALEHVHVFNIENVMEKWLTLFGYQHD